MKKVALILSLLTISVFGFETKSVSGNTSNLSGEFLQGSALKFSTNIGKSLVIECNASYGVVGLSDANYIAYNRISPAHALSSEECEALIDLIKEDNKTLTFIWKKLSCNHMTGCKYQTSYEVK